MGAIIFTLWPWPFSLTHLLKNLILLITFEQWLLELWYFTMSIANGKSFPLFFEFVTLTLEFVLLFKKFNLAYNFRKVSARAFIFYWVLLVARPFRVYQHFLPFDLGVWPNLWKLLTLLKTLEQWVLQLWYYTWVFYETRPHHGYWKFWPYDLDLVVNLLFENVNFVNNIWIVSARALISYISIYSNRSGPWKRTFLSLWPWPGSLTYFWILLIWIVRARALIIHMSIPCDKIFPTVLNLLTLTFDKFFLKLTLVMTSKIWILELPYCTCLFPVTRSFYWYQNICPCDLGHLWNWQLLVAFMFHKHIFLFWKFIVCKCHTYDKEHFLPDFPWVYWCVSSLDLCGCMDWRDPIQRAFLTMGLVSCASVWTLLSQR